MWALLQAIFLEFFSCVDRLMALTGRIMWISAFVGVLVAYLVYKTLKNRKNRKNELSQKMKEADKKHDERMPVDGDVAKRDKQAKGLNQNYQEANVSTAERLRNERDTERNKAATLQNQLDAAQSNNLKLHEAFTDIKKELTNVYKELYRNAEAHTKEIEVYQKTIRVLEAENAALNQRLQDADNARKELGVKKDKPKPPPLVFRQPTNNDGTEEVPLVGSPSHLNRKPAGEPLADVLNTGNTQGLTDAQSQILLDFYIEKQRMQISATKTWKLLEKSGKIPGKKWWNFRDHFYEKLVPRIKNGWTSEYGFKYTISDEWAEHIKQINKETDCINKK